MDHTRAPRDSHLKTTCDSHLKSLSSSIAMIMMILLPGELEHLLGVRSSIHRRRLLHDICEIRRQMRREMRRQIRRHEPSSDTDPATDPATDPETDPATDPTWSTVALTPETHLFELKQLTEHVERS